MSNFAEIDKNNKVIRVLVADNDLPNEGYDWLVQTFGGTWVQTSYNGNIRKRFAGIGYTYDSELDAFIAPKPFESWLLNKATLDWEAPVALPDNQNQYQWDEETQSWIELEKVEEN